MWAGVQMFAGSCTGFVPYPNSTQQSMSREAPGERAVSLTGIPSVYQHHREGQTGCCGDERPLLGCGKADRSQWPEELDN